MKYHNHQIKKVTDGDVDGGCYYEIYRDGQRITSAWSLSNAKEFIDSYDGQRYSWEVLG